MNRSFFPRRAGRAALPALVTLFLAACGGDDAVSPSPSEPRLTDVAPCQEAPGFLCGTLEVPLDPAEPEGPRLALAVAYTDRPDAPHGTVLMLAGGPGQPAVDFYPPHISRDFPEDLFHAVQWVALDQRGTGAQALDCPPLQERIGSSDLLPAPASEVEQCAARLSDVRSFYGSDATVADLDALRRALGVERWTLNGVSYGTYVASQYALAHPEHVQGLVLDSVVPHTGLDLTMQPVVDALPRVLADVCQEQGCTTDPLSDLRLTLERRADDVEIFNWLVATSVFDPWFQAVPQALAEAARGDDQRLNALLAQAAEDGAATAQQLSQGLHVTTLCADQTAPWGDALTPLDEREAWLTQFLDSDLASHYAPFSLDTIAALGTLENCRHWPPIAPAALVRRGPLPDVPTLLMAGGRDLSTPVSETERQLALAPGGTLVVLPQAGHGAQAWPQGLANVAEFLCVGPEALPLPPGSDIAGRCAVDSQPR